MPEQQGSRHLAPTSSPITDPFETKLTRFGVGGLDLRQAVDRASDTLFIRFKNVVHNNDGQLTARPGTQPLTGAADDIHSVKRIEDPEAGDWTRVWGVGTSLGFGKTTITEVDSGYSGSPLSLVAYRPPLSGDPWVFVADSDRCRKIRFDGLDLPIGVTPPNAVPSTSVNAANVTPVIAFDSSDSTDAAAWTGTSGYDYADEPNPTGIPVTTDGGGIDGNTVEFKTVPGDAVFEAAKGYYSFWSMPITRNMDLVGGVTATDDDLFHIWVKLSHPDLTTEVRLYFVVSESFSTGILPGTDPAATNNDFYVKSWRTSDFAQYIMANQDQITAAETARINTVRDQALRERHVEDDRLSWIRQREQVDPLRVLSLETSSAREQWLEYGRIGVPLRRGDFQRVGSTEGRDWSTVTGVVVFLQTANGVGGEVAVSFDDSYLYGGGNLDSVEPGAQPFDWRYTHYDPRTGDESNPSPEMEPSTYLDIARGSVTLTPTPHSDDDMLQRFYRRGGSRIADWDFIGENEENGEPFVDSISDDEASGGGTLELDNDNFITSIDDEGEAILEQPVPIIFGPVQDLLFALGDPNRPGDVYFCKPGRPGSWPPDFHTEVCPPSEELMNGGVFAGQAFTISRQRGYLLQPNLTGTTTTLTAIPTACRRGLAGRWAMAIGLGGIWFVASDGIFRTTGGEEELISEQISPLFQGKEVEGLFPIDMDQARFLKLSIHNHDLIFIYKDTQDEFRELRYSVLYQYWRVVERPNIDIQAAYSDEGNPEPTLILGGRSVNQGYVEGGTDDDGDEIEVEIQTPYQDFGRPREDKLLGDAVLNADRQGVDITVETLLNDGVTSAQSLLVEEGTGRSRYVLTPFGEEPQRARDVSYNISWSTASTPPILYFLGTAIIPEPDITTKRVTQWDDLGSPDEKYLTGCWLECDTGGQTRQIQVEGDLNGVTTTIATLTINSDGRHRFPFSWSVAKTNLVRIRPDDCIGWILYRCDWIAQPEPPRISKWDINYENAWDVYLTGVDLDCDTFGSDKTVEVYLEQTLLETVTVNSGTGRRVIHITVQPPVRGHLMRFIATDNNPGLLYGHRWHYDAEPSEQTNWNQNFTVAGFATDKYLKGVNFECDTYGQDKTVTVEVDGVVVETLTVNANGRKVVEFSFPQHLGRVFRILPTDAFPSRLYQDPILIFDLEPYALTRWETQEMDFDHHLWSVPLYGQITLKSTSDVTLAITTHDQNGNSTTDEYLIESTEGIKAKRHVPFFARKGALFKFVLTSSAAFWLYREESAIRVTLWGTGSTKLFSVFGNDDLDRTRGMTNASLAAARPGGGT